MKLKKVLAFTVAMAMGIGMFGNVFVFADELVTEEVFEPEMEENVVKAPVANEEIIAMMEEAEASGTIVIGSADNTIESLQARAADTPGSWEQISATKWKWEYPDGSYAKNAWICVSNQYYYIGADEYMKFGWMLVDGEYYYGSPSGAIYMNCRKQLSGKNCGFNPSGHLVDLECLVEAVHQAKNNWCWAACAEMVGTYGVASPYNQYHIVNEIKGVPGNLYPDVGAEIEEQKRAIEFASVNSKTASAYSEFISLSSALDELVKNQPFKIGITYVENLTRHAMVVYGLDRNSYEDMLKFVDPAYLEGSNKMMATYSFIKENNTYITGNTIKATLK